jgi:hypothetical protein
MKSTNKTRIAIIVGVCIIISVASMVGLPFMNSDSAMQKISHEGIGKLEQSEEKMLGFITHEKTELETKMGEKTKFP